MYFVRSILLALICILISPKHFDYQLEPVCYNCIDFQVDKSSHCICID